MKKVLFTCTIVMKSLIGFCDPITQEYIEDKINANPNVSCVEYYKKFKCPKGVIFFKKSQDWLEQHELEEDFLKNFYQEEGLNFSYEVSAFEKYSRQLNEKEVANLPENLQAKCFRMVDFESIIDGFCNEILKKFATELKRDTEKLRNVLVDWIKNKNVYAYFCNIVYTPNEAIQNKCKENMSKAIEKLLNYPAGQKMLILALSIEIFLEKSLKVFISDCGAYAIPGEGIALDFLDNPNIEAQALYHEINHWIHHILGLEATSKIAGDFSTSFEKDFLQLKNIKFYQENADVVKDEIYLHESSGVSCNNKEKALKIFDIQTTWDCLEELWNIVGFANVNNVIYVNCLSDMDLLSQSPWGHATQINPNNCDKILVEIYEEGPKKPAENAWKFWVQLHDLPKGRQYLFTHNYFDQAIQAQTKIFNIPSELSKVEKERLLEVLLSPVFAADTNDLLEKWKKENPELFEKIDALRSQANCIMDKKYIESYNAIWEDK